MFIVVDTDNLPFVQFLYSCVQFNKNVKTIIRCVGYAVYKEIHETTITTILYSY